MGETFVPPTSHPELMARLASDWSALQAAFADVPDAIATRPGRGGWSAQDQITHIAAWERSVTGLLRGEDRATTLNVPPALWAASDIDGINAVLQARMADWPRSQAVAEAEAAHAALLTELNQLSWDELHRPRSHFAPQLPDPAESPEMIGWVYGDTIDHYPEHLAYLRRIVIEVAGGE